MLLRKDAPGELRRVVSDSTGKESTRDEATGIAEGFSFERQPGRRSGEEDKGSLVRKGVVGDWRNRFSPQVREMFGRYAGKELVLLGYEQNRDWVRGEASGAGDGAWCPSTATRSGGFASRAGSPAPTGTSVSSAPVHSPSTDR